MFSVIVRISSPSCIRYLNLLIRPPAFGWSSRCLKYLSHNPGTHLYNRQTEINDSYFLCHAWHVKILQNITTRFLKVWVFKKYFLSLLTVCFHLWTRPCIPTCSASSFATGARHFAPTFYWDNVVIAVLFQTPLLVACVVCTIHLA